MAAAPARALAADKRWGFAAAAAAPGRPPAARAVEAAPKPTNLPTQRGALPWGNRPMPPAPNAWGSSSLLSLKKGEGSGSFVNINDGLSSPGSSSTSTDESDLLDSPVARGRTSHDSVTAISRPQSTGSGSWKFAHSQISFLDVLNVPLRTNAKKRPTSHRKGFTICADDFPVLDSKNSQSNGQQGHCFQGWPSFSSVVIATRDEPRKIPLTGDPVSTANFSWEPEQAQLLATQTPDMCMPPPCIDYWHPPPDHPPDRNGIHVGGVVSYGLCNPADKTVSFPVESHDGQSVLNQGGEERHGPHGVYHPRNNGSCYAHVPVDTFVKSLPHLILEKVKDNHSDALEKQPVIKKDVALLEKINCLPHHIHGKVKSNHSDALEKQPFIKKNVPLLEKIKCLNIKARSLRARNMPEISLCKDSKVECPKILNLKADHVANDVPFSAATSYITSAFDMPNSVSVRSNHELVGTSNMSAILVTTDLSEGPVTEFSEAKKMCNSADNHVYGVADTSTNLCGSSAMDTASNIWGHGWKEHSTVYSLPVTTTNYHEDQPFAGNCSQQVHATTANDMLKSPYEIQHSISQQKAESIAKLEFVQSQKSNDAPGKSCDSHVYGGWNAVTNKLGCAEDIPFNISRHGWEGHPAVDSLPLMTKSHQDQPFPWNTSKQGDVLTDDILNSPHDEIEHSRWRESSTKHTKQLQMESENIEHKATFIAKPEDLSIRPFVLGLKSNDAPGESADYHVYAGWNASRNRHGSSAEDISFSMPGHGWKDHSTADSLSVVRTDTYQEQSFPEGTSLQLSRRELSAQHPKQLQEEDRGKLQQKAKANAKLELKRCLFVQNQMSNDVPQETNKNLCKQNAGSSGTSSHDASVSDTCCTVYAVNVNVPPRPNAANNTATAISSTQNMMCAAKKTGISTLEHIAEKTEAESHDSCAPKHLQMEDREGRVHKQKSISRGSTPASDTADANRSPFILNTISPVKNTEIKIMEQIDPKGVSRSNESRTPMSLQMEDKRRQVHSHGRILRGCTPASGPAGVNKGSLIHNGMPSAKNNENSMMEYIAWRSASQSHENSIPKGLPMENRRRQVHQLERVLRERSNIAESTEDIRIVSGTHVHTRNVEAKSRVDLSTQIKNRPVSPCVFGIANTETSGLRKAPVSGVVINSSIITMQAALARGFTVGSIMLGDASVASLNQEKTVAKEVDYDTTNSCASPKQIKQSGKNQHDEQHAKDPHGGDSIMCTEVKDPSKKEWLETGGMNCMAIHAPMQPYGNQRIVYQGAAPAKTSEMERHAHKPEYKVLHLQNPRQMLQAEKHTTSSDNSSTSKLETKSHDKEALDTCTAIKSEIKTGSENWADEKNSKHLGRSSTVSDQVSTNCSAASASDLTEQEANSLVLNIMQELSDQLEQMEKQLDSTHVVAVSRSEQTQTVSLPGYTWGEHRVSQSQRQYHVDGQGNVWFSYAADMCGITQGPSALPTAHVLPGPISVPENSALNGCSTPVWTWDDAEGILTSDMSNVPVVGTSITSRSSRELTESIYGVGQMDLDLHCMQVIGGMSYEAVAANPEIIHYHECLANQQVNPAWFPHSQQDVSYHSSSGTGVYWPRMDVGAVMQTHGVTGPVVGAGHPGYQLMSVATPGAAYTGSAMVSTGHPLAAATWGVAYGEHVYH